MPGATYKNPLYYQTCLKLIDDITLENLKMTVVPICLNFVIVKTGQKACFNATPRY